MSRVLIQMKDPIVTVSDQGTTSYQFVAGETSAVTDDGVLFTTYFGQLAIPAPSVVALLNLVDGVPYPDNSEVLVVN